jgi:hypothetical protein
VAWFEGFKDLLPTKRFLGFDALGGCEDIGSSTVLAIEILRTPRASGTRRVTVVESPHRQWCGPSFKIQTDPSPLVFKHSYVLGVWSYLSVYNLLVKVNMDESEDGRCVMRGSCGKKGFFGKQLPCPDNGPPQQVSVVECLLSMDLTVIIYFTA